MEDCKQLGGTRAVALKTMLQGCDEMFYLSTQTVPNKTF
jgi:hypothetical protein